MKNEEIINVVRKSAFWIDPEHPQIIYLNTQTLKDDLEQISKAAVEQEEKVCDHEWKRNGETNTKNCLKCGTWSYV